MNTPLPPQLRHLQPSPSHGGCRGTPSRPRGSCPCTGSDLTHGAGNPLTNDAIQLTQTHTVAFGTLPVCSSNQSWVGHVFLWWVIKCLVEPLEMLRS